MDHIIFDFPSDPQYWSEKYRGSLSEPKAWIHVARNIVHGMDCLRPVVVDFWKEVADSVLKNSPNGLNVQKTIHGVYLMLASYALENLLKALLIKKRSFGPESFSAGLPKEIDTHNLEELANSVGIEVGDSEKELLKRLSAYAYWAGRYPAPVNEKYIRPVEMTNTVTNVPTYWRGRDLRSIEELLTLLFTRLDVPAPMRNIAPFDATPQRWEVGMLYENISPW